MVPSFFYLGLGQNPSEAKWFCQYKINQDGRTAMDSALQLSVVPVGRKPCAFDILMLFTYPCLTGL